MARLVVFAALLVPVGALAQRNVPAEEQCYHQPSHSEARACLQTLARASARGVQEAEATALAALDRWNEDASAKSRSISALEASSLAFNRMRTAQCEFQATLAAGGNGASDRRLLCEIEVNERRMADLHASEASLQ